MKLLKTLYKRLDELFPDIYHYCEKCTYEDCIGYVWLLPDEAEELYEKGVQIVEINREISFIDSFHKKNGIVDTEAAKPSCVLRNSDNKCSIYSFRPLVCRLYPLDLKKVHDTIFVVLHTDCLFVEVLTRNGNLDPFLNQCVGTIKKTDKELLVEMEKTFRNVESISHETEDYENNYIKILDLSAYLRLKE